MYKIPVFDPSQTTKGTFDTKLPVGGKFLVCNQSNINVDLIFANGDDGYAPAWQITQFTQPTPSSNVKWAQQTTLAGNTSPISQIVVQCFLPNENIPGTYPVAVQHTAYIPNVVGTNAVVNSLSSENGAVGTEIIDVGTVNNNKIIDIFNDHFIWSIEQSTVKHQILKGQTSGNPLQIGQSGDISEILGNLTVDGSSSFDNANLTTDGSGHLIIKNNTSLQFKNLAGTVKGVLRLDNLNNINLIMADNNLIVIIDKSSNNVFIIDNTSGITAQGSNNIGLGTGGTPRNVLDYSSGILYLKGASGIHLQVPSGTDVMTLDSSGNLTVTGSFNNPAGKVGAIINLGGSPYWFVQSVNYTVGSPITYTIAGNGGIPSNATGVFIAGYGIGTAIGTYLQSYPLAGSPPSNPSNSSLLWQTQAANQTNVGSAYCQLNGSGQLVIQTFNGTMNSTNLSVYAYIA